MLCPSRQVHISIRVSATARSEAPGGRDGPGGKLAAGEPGPAPVHPWGGRSISHAPHLAHEAVRGHEVRHGRKHTSSQVTHIEAPRHVATQPMLGHAHNGDRLHGRRAALWRSKPACPAPCPLRTLLQRVSAPAPVSRAQAARASGDAALDTLTVATSRLRLTGSPGRTGERGSACGADEACSVPQAGRPAAGPAVGPHGQAGAGGAAAAAGAVPSGAAAAADGEGAGRRGALWWVCTAAVKSVVRGQEEGQG